VFFLHVKILKLPGENPKSEARNPKQTPTQMDLKSGKFKTRDPERDLFGILSFCSFEIVLNFGFRVSNFSG